MSKSNREDENKSIPDLQKPNAETGWHIEICDDSKHWSLAGKNFHIKNLASGYICNGELTVLDISELRKQENGWLLELANEQVKLLLEFEIIDNSLLEMKASITIHADRALNIDSVVIACIDKSIETDAISLNAPEQTYRILINAFDSWEQTGSRGWLKELLNKDNGDVPADKASMVTAIWSTLSRETVLFGSCDVSDYPLSFNWVDRLDEAKESFVIERQVNLALEPGRQICLGTIACNQGRDLCEALSDYANRYFKVLETPEEMFVGWSTWDYYLLNPCMADIRENIQAVKSDEFLRDKVKLISVDYGWFNYPGDWRANIDFKSNRAAIAEEIISEGFIPGIWTMPLLVGPNAALARTNVDWFIRDDKGDHVNVNKDEWPEPIFSLDFTVPDVQEYIYNLYRQMHKEGYRYFKLDFIKQSMRQPQWPLSDPNVTRLKMVRLSLETIRRAVGHKSVITACGVPFEAAVGIANFVRTCNDVKGYWSNFQQCARSISHRFWCHRNLCYSDPDFLIVRGKDTADLSEDRYILPHSKKHIPFEWLSGEPATLNEVQVWATIQIISGGPLILSDRLVMLNKKAKDIISKVFANHRFSSFVPLDIMDNSAPRLWARLSERNKQSKSKYDMLAIFNWFDESQTVDVSGRELPKLWYDVWQDKPVTLARTIEVPGRSACLLKLNNSD